MNIEDKIITFLIAQRSKNADFFRVFDNAVIFKDKANVVVLEDANALQLVLENFPTNTKFRLLIHADIGDKNTDDEITKEAARLKTVVSGIKAIQGCNNIEPFFITRSGKIEEQCIKQSKCFVKLESSNVMCSYTSLWSTDEFLQELKPVSKGMPICNGETKPKIFIGSSNQGLEYANKIKEYFDNDKNYDAHVWTSEFTKNNVTIECLEKILQNFQYSIFVFTPDDTITIEKDGSKTEKKIPRDNVIFEYGLFYGKYSRTKTFLVLPQDYETTMKTMSDIKGLNPYTYTDDQTNILNAVTTACNSIIEEIKKQN